MKRLYTDRELRDFFKDYKEVENPKQIMENILQDKRSLDYLDLLSVREDIDVKTIEEIDEKPYTNLITKIQSDKKITNIIEKIKSQIPPRPKAKPDEPGFGQIYETALPLNWPYPEQERRMVVVLSNDDGCFDPEHPDVVIAPISFDVQYACDTDVLISRQDSLLNTDFLIRLGDIQNIFVRQLKNFYGVVQEKYHKEIKDIWKYSVGVKDKDAIKLKHTAIQSKEDPRYNFSLKEYEISKYIREPVLRMIRLADELEDVTSVDFSNIISSETIQEEYEIYKEFKKKYEPQTYEEAVDKWREYSLAADSTDYAAISLQTAGKRFTLIRRPNFEIVLIFYNDYLRLMYKPITVDDKVEITIIYGESVLVSKTFSNQLNKEPYLMVLHPSAKYINKILQLRVNNKIELSFRIYHEYI